MSRKWIGYSVVELAWIKRHRTKNRRVAHAAFCQKFNRMDVSLRNYKALCVRKGWLTGRTGCFEKGHTPVNRGRRMPFNANSARTQFKKGQSPSNIKPMYTERITSDGYVEIKVPGRNPHTGADSHFILKHHWEWEKRNGRVPRGYALKCLDGNRTHTCPANWELIPRAILPCLSSPHGRGFDQAEPEVRPLIMAVTRLEYEAQTRKRTERE